MFQLPTEATVRDLLSMMVGKDVAVRFDPNPALDAAAVAAVARYVDDEGTTLALGACDLQAANSLGAALALIPKGRVLEAVKAKQVPKDFADNLHEVFNVGANLFNAPDRTHVRLAEVATTGDLPADLVQKVATSSTRLDLRIDVPGYGPGVFVVVGLA